MIRLTLFVTVFALIGVNNSFGGEQQTGFGYELIHSKLEHLEHRFSKLLIQLQQQVEGLQERLETVQSQITTNGECSKGKEATISDQIKTLQTTCSNHDSTLNSWFDLHFCKVPTKRLTGLCLTDWLIVLQRFDGAENFNRKWVDYRNGFGTAGQEFWIGLEELHALTNNNAYELLVELEDFSGKYRYAHYNKFSVGTESNFYPLDDLGEYSGTAGDSFRTHKGKQFSALDKGPESKCAKSFTGGWWYDSCYDSHLTGKWTRTDAWTSIVWRKFGYPEFTALKFARMMIRKI